MTRERILDYFQQEPYNCYEFINPFIVDDKEVHTLKKKNDGIFVEGDYISINIEDLSDKSLRDIMAVIMFENPIKLRNNEKV